MANQNRMSVGGHKYRRASIHIPCVMGKQNYAQKHIKTLKIVSKHVYINKGCFTYTAPSLTHSLNIIKNILLQHSQKQASV